MWLLFARALLVALLLHVSSFSGELHTKRDGTASLDKAPAVMMPAGRQVDPPTRLRAQLPPQQRWLEPPRGRRLVAPPVTQHKARSCARRTARRTHLRRRRVPRMRDDSDEH